MSGASCGWVLCRGWLRRWRSCSSHPFGRAVRASVCRAELGGSIKGSAVP